MHETQSGLVLSSPLHLSLHPASYPHGAFTPASSSCPHGASPLHPARTPASPAVAAIGPRHLSAGTVPLPGQQAQAAAVAGRHADSVVGTQHLTRRSVTAWLAVPNPVLGDSKGGPRSAESRAEGTGKGRPGRKMKWRGRGGRGEKVRGSSSELLRSTLSLRRASTGVSPPGEEGEGEESLRGASLGAVASME